MQVSRIFKKFTLLLWIFIRKNVCFNRTISDIFEIEEFGRNSMPHIVPKTEEYFNIFSQNTSKFVITPADKKSLIMAKNCLLKFQGNESQNSSIPTTEQVSIHKFENFLF